MWRMIHMPTPQRLKALEDENDKLKRMLGLYTGQRRAAGSTSLWRLCGPNRSRLLRFYPCQESGGQFVVSRTASRRSFLRCANRRSTVSRRRIGDRILGYLLFVQECVGMMHSASRSACILLKWPVVAFIGQQPPEGTGGLDQVVPAMDEVVGVANTHQQPLLLI